MFTPHSSKLVNLSELEVSWDSSCPELTLN